MTKHVRRPLISGNWKMHLNHFEAISAVQKLEYLLEKDDTEFVDVSIHPPFTDLRSVQTLIDADKVPVKLGAQNCHWDDKGAFTGEISPIFLSKLNVSLVIAGHSERRELFGETDDMVNKKVRAILAHGMTPIMCVGETLEEREAGQTEPKVLGQLQAGLAGVSAEQVSGLVVAYEPIWAIGTGRVASTADAQAVCASLRKTVGQLHGTDAANAVRIQYGGSVKPSNIAELMAERDIDGALVGGASLDPDEFVKIVRFGRE